MSKRTFTDARGYPITVVRQRPTSGGASRVVWRFEQKGSVIGRTVRPFGHDLLESTEEELRDLLKAVREVR